MDLNKGYYIYTFGCAMNEYDSERISSSLEMRGYYQVLDTREATVIILNTCSVRAKPEIKIASYLGVIAKDLKRNDRDVIIGLTGCVAQDQGKKLLKAFPLVNFVIGTDAVANFDELIDRALAGERFVDTSLMTETFVIEKFKRKSKISAQVTIMKGCENFCTYCIVPYVRGVEVSRDVKEITDEVKALIAGGSKEIMLLGQNVNSYRGKLTDGSIADFGDLLSYVNDIEGVKRIRFITSHPKDFDEELVDIIAKLDKVCKYIHLPAQSGSNNILEKMSRCYTVEDYKRKIDYAKKIIPNISFSSDFIVGFPDETEEEFQQSLDLISYAEFDHVFAFKYSSRPGTKAATFSDSLDKATKSRRLAELFVLKDEIVTRKLEKLIGEEFEILITGRSSKDSSQFHGLTEQNRGVAFTSTKELKLGDMVNVRILEARPNSLLGEQIE